MGDREVKLAEDALRHFGGNPSRSKAAAMLDMWAGRFMLTDTDRAEVLRRFNPGAEVTR